MAKRGENFYRKIPLLNRLMFENGELPCSAMLSAGIDIPPSGREAIILFRPFSLSFFRGGPARLRASSPAVQPLWPGTHPSFAGVFSVL